MGLRLGVLIFGGLLLIVALLLTTHPAFWGIALYLGVYGVVIVGGILIERSHYRPPVDRTQGAWEPTGERFLDPTTGQLMEVYQNPATGERDYVRVPKTGR